jgi:hypothetical protein
MLNAKVGVAAAVPGGTRSWVRHRALTAQLTGEDGNALLAEFAIVQLAATANSTLSQIKAERL